jgi:ATP adenylyltransferase
MEHLWTPWRMAYLRGDEPAPDGCLFCALPAHHDTEAHIVHRGRLAYVVLNRFPYNNGHLMVVPFAHAPSPEDLTDETLVEMMALAKISLQALRQAYGPDGFNVGMNIGETAGAGVAGHVHVHIVPRWGGDTNYLTTTGQTRVIAEWMEQTFQRLHPLFQRLCAD